MQAEDDSHAIKNKIRPNRGPKTQLTRFEKLISPTLRAHRENQS